MLQHGHAYKGVPLENHVATTEQSLQLFQIKCLQITAHVQQRITLVGAECLDLAAHPKMIVSAVEFAGSWAARIVEDQTLKALEPFRVELAQCFDEGALPNAGRTAQNHETPTRLRHPSPHLSVLSVPVNPLEVGLRFEKPFVHLVK